MAISRIVGILATILSVSFIWPQVFRVFAKNSTEGLVPSSFLQGCCGSLLWTIYGSNKPDPQLVFANANVVIAILLILFVCVKHKKIVWWIPALALSSTLILGLIAASYSLSIMGWVTIAIGTPAIIPQVVRVYRTEHLYGVSTTMHGLLFACCISWFSYGAMIGDWFVSLPNIIGMSGALYIWIRAAQSHEKFTVPDELEIKTI